MKTHTRIVLALVACVAAAVTAYATVMVDENGEGFVGKGDVQTIFGWNNAQLQANADQLTFHYSSLSTTVQETTWACLNNGGNEVGRSSTTTTTTGVSNPNAALARVRNQITGFNLTSDNADFEDGTPVTVGFEPGFCPSGQSFVEGSIVVGDPVTDPNSTRTLTVCYGDDCRDIALE
jgi:hypothetical protein